MPEAGCDEPIWSCVSSSDRLDEQPQSAHARFYISQIGGSKAGEIILNARTASVGATGWSGLSETHLCIMACLNKSAAVFGFTPSCEPMTKEPPNCRADAPPNFGVVVPGVLHALALVTLVVAGDVELGDWYCSGRWPPLAEFCRECRGVAN
jgi:hypothetical protein